MGDREGGGGGSLPRFRSEGEISIQSAFFVGFCIRLLDSRPSFLKSELMSFRPQDGFRQVVSDVIRHGVCLCY